MTTISKAGAGWFLAALMCLTCAQAEAADLKLEARLVWGTNDDKSPNPNHKPVEADIARKLKELPLKWANYFEVNRKCFTVAPSGVNRAALSDACQIEVKNLGNSRVEVTHFGKGQQVWKGTQSLPKGEVLVLGGNPPNSTSWLVILRRIE